VTVRRSSHILGSGVSPLPKALEFLEKGTTLRNRLHPRYPVEYTAAFLGAGITASGVILNLSSGGCRVRSGEKLRQGEVLQVLIDVPRYQTLLEVNQAMVQWSNGDEFGLKFSGSPTEEDPRLQNELILAAQAASRQGKVD
jgi:hypothetical protein